MANISEAVAHHRSGLSISLPLADTGAVTAELHTTWPHPPHPAEWRGEGPLSHGDTAAQPPAGAALRAGLRYPPYNFFVGVPISRLLTMG